MNCQVTNLFAPLIKLQIRMRGGGSMAAAPLVPLCHCAHMDCWALAWSDGSAAPVMSQFVMQDPGNVLQPQLGSFCLLVLDAACLSCLCGHGRSTGLKTGFWLLWSAALLNNLRRNLIIFCYPRICSSFFVCKQSWPLLNRKQVFHQCLFWRFLRVIPGTCFSWPQVFLLENVPMYPRASSQPTPLMNLAHCHLSSWSWFFFSRI